MNSTKIIEDVAKGNGNLESRPLNGGEERRMESEIPGGAFVALKSEENTVKNAAKAAEKGAETFCVSNGEASIAEIMRELRNACPDAYLISDDYAADVEDIRNARSGGANAVIVSPSVMDRAALERVFSCAEKEGVKILFRFNDATDIAKARHLRPEAAFLNDRPRRDLSSDLLNPIFLRELIDWECRCFFVSSSGSFYDAALAGCEGFAGIVTPLYGEDMKRYFKAADPSRRGLWTRLAARRRYTRPFVKVGGLKRAQDANLASNLGADILGFDAKSFEGSSVFDVLSAVVSSGAAKVISVDAQDAASLETAEKLLKNGLADGVEFLGELDPGRCVELAGSNFYRAVRINGGSAFRVSDLFAGARTLLSLGDASPSKFSETVYDYIDNVSPRVWLSGSLSCDNVGAVIKKFRPELVEAAEGIETPDGCKDPALMRKFFKNSLYSK